jgi:hypothetical protein
LAVGNYAAFVVDFAVQAMGLPETIITVAMQLKALAGLQGASWRAPCFQGDLSCALWKKFTVTYTWT